MPPLSVAAASLALVVGAPRRQAVLLVDGARLRPGLPVGLVIQLGRLDRGTAVPWAAAALRVRLRCGEHTLEWTGMSDASGMALPVWPRPLPTPCDRPALEVAPPSGPAVTAELRLAEGELPTPRPLGALPFVRRGGRDASASVLLPEGPLVPGLVSRVELRGLSPGDGWSAEGDGSRVLRSDAAERWSLWLQPEEESPSLVLRRGDDAFLGSLPVATPAVRLRRDGAVLSVEAGDAPDLLWLAVGGAGWRSARVAVRRAHGASALTVPLEEFGALGPEPWVGVVSASHTVGQEATDWPLGGEAQPVSPTGDAAWRAAPDQPLVLAVDADPTSGPRRWLSRGLLAAVLLAAIAIGARLGLESRRAGERAARLLAAAEALTEGTEPTEAPLASSGGRWLEALSGVALLAGMLLLAWLVWLRLSL